MRNDTLRRFVRLLRDRKKTEAHLEVVKRAIAEMQPRVLEEFVRAGVSLVEVNKMRLYLKRAIYAKTPSKGPDWFAFLEALRSSQFADYIKEQVNANSLSRLLRDLEKELGQPFPSCAKLIDLQGIALPEAIGPLAGHLGVAEVYTITDRQPGDKDE